MTILLHAQPYDISAVGFFFESHEDYTEKAANLRTAHGDPIDCDLAHAIGLSQANLKRFFEVVADWDDDDKTRVILSVGECGYAFGDSTRPNDFDLDIYYMDSMRDLAEQFVEEGLFGDTPERLTSYVDYDAFVRDLSIDHAEAEVAGTALIYRCD